MPSLPPENCPPNPAPNASTGLSSGVRTLFFFRQIPNLRDFSIFVGLPLAFLLLAWCFVDAGSRERFTSEQERRLEQHLFRLKRESSPTGFIERQLSELSGLLLEDTVDTKTLAQHYRRLSPDLSFVSLYFFDAEGGPIPFSPALDAYRGVVTRLYSAFREYERMGTTTLMNRYRPFFRSLLSEIPPEQAFTEKSTLMKISLGGQRGYLFWNSSEGTESPAAGPGAKTGGGMIALFTAAQIPDNLGVKDVIAEMNQHASAQTSFGVLHHTRPPHSLPAGLRPLPDDTTWDTLNRTIRNMRESFRSFHHSSTGILVIHPLDENRTAFGFSPVPTTYTPVFILTAIALIALFLFFSVIGSPSLPAPTTSLHPAILRSRLFLLACGMPLIAFLGLAGRFLPERQKTLVREQFRFLEQLNSTVDEQVTMAGKDLAVFCRRIAGAPAVRHLDPQGLARLAGHIKKNRLEGRLTLINRHGEILFTDSGKQIRKGMADKFLPTFARKLFAKKFGGEKTRLQDRIADSMVDNLTDSVAEFVLGPAAGPLLDRILTESDRLHELEIGRQTSMVYFTFVTPAKNPDPILMTIVFPKRGLTRAYLDRIVKNRERRKAERQPVRLAYAPAFGETTIVPATLSKYRFSKDMLQRVLETRSQQSEIHPIGDEEYLIVGTPLIQAADFVFFAMSPKSRIDGELFVIGGFIMLLTILSLLFALSLTRFL